MLAPPTTRRSSSREPGLIRAPSPVRPPANTARLLPDLPTKPENPKSQPHDTWFDSLRREYAEMSRAHHRRLREEQSYEGDDWGDPDEDDWGRQKT